SHLCGQSVESAHVIFGEVVSPSMLQVEHTDDFVFVDQRNAQFGARLRIHLDIARILRDIGNEYRFAVLGRVSDQALPHGDFVLELNIFTEAEGKTMVQHPVGFVQQQDGEHLVVNQAQQKITDAFQQLIEIKDRG